VETEFIAAIARANLAAALAIIAVLLLRGGVRRLFGSQKAYALWSLTPIAALATLLPARHVIDVVTSAPVRVTPMSKMLPTTVARLAEFHTPQVSIPLQPPQTSLAQIILALWLVGVLASICLLAWRQHRFVRSLGPLERRDFDGFSIFQAQGVGAVPALLGAIRPRVIVPSDFDERFDVEERRLILAHERAHLLRGDAQINALIALSTCLCWFNPLAHVAAFAMRRDQELACDAAVLARRPEAKRSYAATLLKAQLAEVVIAFGCAWPAKGRDSLHERIDLLGAQHPALGRRVMGTLGIAAVIVGGGAAAWAAQPAIHTSTFRIEGQRAEAPPAQQARGQDWRRRGRYCGRKNRWRVASGDELGLSLTAFQVLPESERTHRAVSARPGIARCRYPCRYVVDSVTMLMPSRKGQNVEGLDPF
jgi:beta-lactamase regulating signal transducer with metallopeptidase domain